MPDKTEKRAKLFMNGHSQAVRLPKEFRFVGSEVRIRRSGIGVLLEPIGPQVGAKDLERVREVIKTLGPLEPKLVAVVDEAMRKLESGAD
jgi:virulence-associated protein VagC